MIVLMVFLWLVLAVSPVVVGFVVGFFFDWPRGTVARVGCALVLLWLLWASSMLSVEYRQKLEAWAAALRQAEPAESVEVVR